MPEIGRAGVDGISRSDPWHATMHGTYMRANVQTDTFNLPNRKSNMEVNISNKPFLEQQVSLRTLVIIISCLFILYSPCHLCIPTTLIILLKHYRATLFSCLEKHSYLLPDKMAVCLTKRNRKNRHTSCQNRQTASLVRDTSQLAHGLACQNTRPANMFMSS